MTKSGRNSGTGRGKGLGQCTTLKCPKCGHTMIREELLNDKRSKD